jgi:hypothetical protein
MGERSKSSGARVAPRRRIEYGFGKAKTHLMNWLGRVQAYLAFLSVQSDLSWHVVRIIIRSEEKTPAIAIGRVLTILAA